MAIAIEVFALYSHSKLSNRIDEHIVEVDRNLERNDSSIEDLDENISKIGDRMIILDEHISGLVDRMNRLDEHVIKLDGHMNRLDDFIWTSYFQRTQTNVLPKEAAKQQDDAITP